MQVFSTARRLSKALQSPISLNSYHFLSSDLRSAEAPHFAVPWQNARSFSSQIPWFPGMARHNYRQVTTESLRVHFVMSKAFYTSKVNTGEGSPTDAVKELYDKMLDSVNVKRSMPPNAWLWSMIEKSENHDDIRLLFNILQNLRRFRLSNLRIHLNFNDNLCREVTNACARVGALDFGKKVLGKHNVYGLTPSVASAHHLLSYAKNHNDTKLLVEVMKLLKRNALPLQPGTADIVFRNRRQSGTLQTKLGQSGNGPNHRKLFDIYPKEYIICYNTDKWELINKYAKRFVKDGVKLRQTSYDIWMEFAAKRGDTESLWKIEKLRSESMKQHTLASGLACAKVLLLERKPSDAAAIIQALNQTLSDAKKSGIKDELQKLVSDWPLEVIKHQKEEDRKALAATLKSDIPAMVNDLLSMGLEAKYDDTMFQKMHV